MVLGSYLGPRLTLGAALILLKSGFPFHTFQLPIGKLFHVVLRDVPVGLTEEALIQMGYSPEGITRMRQTEGKRPMPMVVGKLSREQIAIYHIKEILGLQISTEPLKIVRAYRSIFAARCMDTPSRVVRLI